jgi:membrane associated rhomboid family serine protease
MRINPRLRPNARADVHKLSTMSLVAGIAAMMVGYGLTISIITGFELAGIAEWRVHAAGFGVGFICIALFFSLAKRKRWNM